jgi:EH_Signature domain
MTPRIKLPEMKFKLSGHVGIENIEFFQKMAKELHKYVQSGGTLSKRFQKRKDEIYEKVRKGQQLNQIIENKYDIRATVALWCESEPFRTIAPVDSKIISKIKKLSPDLKGSVLRLFVRLYFEQFDELGEGYKPLIKLIREGLNDLHGNRRFSSDILIWKKNNNKLFRYDGPNNLVANASRRNVQLKTVAKEWKIPDGSPGRFYQVSKFIYYIKTLEEIPLHSHHDLFSELTKKEVHDSPYKNGLTVGHAVVKLLIDRLINENERISENWSNFVLSIMGDPRIPKQSKKFQKWWSRLPKKHIDAMIGWLSQWDLKLFLKILEEVGEVQNSKNMLRMYPARKRFLEGLYDEGLIENTRLLLGRDAVGFLRRNVDQNNWPEFAFLDSAENSQSLIYLDIHGISILEGTHNFALRIYEEFPIIGLANYEKKRFNLNSIRSFKSDIEPITHSYAKKPIWQHKLMSALAKNHNIRIDPEKVLSRNDYQIYRREYGMGHYY